MLITSTYFFTMKPPDSVVHPHTSALGQACSLVSPSTITSSYQPKRNYQMSTPWYKHSGTPTSSFFFTTQCTLSGTLHTTRPSMYLQVVHSLERTPFRSCTTCTDTSCLTLLMVSGGNTCWDNIPTLSPPMCHTHRFHFKSKM